MYRVLLASCSLGIHRVIALAHFTMLTFPRSVVILLSLLAPQSWSHPHNLPRQFLGSSFGVPEENRTFDYVIVGGGNAGLTLAARLSEDSRNLVAVIEAGSFYELTNGNLSQIPADDVSWTSKSLDDVNPLVDWGFTTTPQAVRK